LPAPKVAVPNNAPAPAAAPARPAQPPRPSSPPTATVSFLLDDPDTAIPVALSAPSKPVAALQGASPRAGKASARAKPVEQQAAVPAQSGPATAAPSARGGAVRGEMIIRSGTDEAEARALAESLRATGAFVRPVHHGDTVIYEVVMGLSG